MKRLYFFSSLYLFFFSGEGFSLFSPFELSTIFASPPQTSWETTHAHTAMMMMYTAVGTSDLGKMLRR